MKRQRGYDRPSWLQKHPGAMHQLAVGPAVLYLGLFFMCPLVGVLIQSLFTPQFTLREYERVFGSSAYIRILWTTVKVSWWVAAGTVLIGYPVAAGLNRLRGALLTGCLSAIMIPLWTSALVRNYALIVVLRRGGIITSVLKSFGIHLMTPLLYNTSGVLIGMIYTLLPYAILVLYGALRDTDLAYARAACSLGATPLRAFLAVFLPLSLPGVLAAFLLIFMLSVGFYVTPALLGGGRVEMIAPQIDVQMNYLLNWGFGSALSIVLLAVVSVLVLAFMNILDLEVFGLRGRRLEQSPTVFQAPERNARSWAHLDLGRKLMHSARAPDISNRGRARTRPRAYGQRLLSIFVISVIAAMLLPVIIIADMSFTTTSYLAFPSVGFTFRWYVQYLTSQSWIGATRVSLQVAALSAAAALVIGVFASVGLARGRSAVNTLLLLIVFAPLIVPAVVIGVASYVFFGRLHILGSVWPLVLTHIVLSIPVVVITVLGALRSLDESLGRAAAVLGARPARALCSITLPMIRPALMVGFLLAFIHSFDEVVVAQFIAGTGIITLPKKMWVSLLYNVDPTISAISTLLVLLSLVVVGSAYLYTWSRTDLSKLH
jgi:putative spermidine/putrescine transport system permease protein